MMSLLCFVEVAMRHPARLVLWALVDADGVASLSLMANLLLGVESDPGLVRGIGAMELLKAPN